MPDFTIIASPKAIAAAIPQSIGGDNHSRYGKSQLPNIGIVIKNPAHSQFARCLFCKCTAIRLAINGGSKELAAIKMPLMPGQSNMLAMLSTMYESNNIAAVRTVAENRWFCVFF